MIKLMRFLKKQDMFYIVLCAVLVVTQVWLDLTMPDFSPLAHVGGSMSVGGMGYQGVRITRTSYSDFVAFELACPTDHDACLVVDPEWGGSILVCPVCSSRFNALDGTPFSGAVSPCPLYQYCTILEGSLLSVY